MWCQQQPNTGYAVQATIQELESFDPAAAGNLHKIQDMDAAAFAALLKLDGLPLEASKVMYISMAVRRILVDAVQWQHKAFTQVRDMHCCRNVPHVLA